MGPVLCSGEFQLARAEILHVHVGSGFCVVQQIPFRVVRIVIHYEILCTVPTPIGGLRPIPGSYLKVEAAGKPEHVTVPVEPTDSE